MAVYSESHLPEDFGLLIKSQIVGGNLPFVFKAFASVIKNGIRGNLCDIILAILFSFGADTTITVPAKVVHQFDIFGLSSKKHTSS